jgi:hypothetical protein
VSAAITNAHQRAALALFSEWLAIMRGPVCTRWRSFSKDRLRFRLSKGKHGHDRVSRLPGRRRRIYRLPLSSVLFCEDDDEALAEAVTLVDRDGVELWRGTARIRSCRVPKSKAARPLKVWRTKKERPRKGHFRGRLQPVFTFKGR